MRLATFELASEEFFLPGRDFAFRARREKLKCCSDWYLNARTLISVFNAFYLKSKAMI